MKCHFSVIPLALIMMLFLPQGSRAADDVDELKRQIQQLQNRVDQLEQERSQPAPSGQSQGPLTNSFPDHFSQMQRLQEEMNQMFENFYSGSKGSGFNAFDPALEDNEINLKESKEGYEININTQGLDQNKLDVKVDEHSITVQGEHSEKHSQDNPQGSFQQESFGTFMKTIPLPLDADTSKMVSEKKGDSLVIRIPKK